MKKIIFLLLCISWSEMNAQIIDPNQTTRTKATNRANSRIDQGIDKGLDKVEEGIGNLFKKKDKTKKKDSGQADNLPDENGSSSQQSAPASTQAGSRVSTPFSSYSKFDFIPGEKVIAMEDFSQDAVGDFPAKWNTNGSGEVVTISGKNEKWLKFVGEGAFYPEFLGVLDDNMTIEFDLATSEAHHLFTKLYFVDSKQFPNLLSHSAHNSVQVDLDPTTGASAVLCRDENDAERLSNSKDVGIWKVPDNLFVKVSIWRQKTRLRLYLNETKVWDIPRAFVPGVPYRLVFETATFFVPDKEVYITNLRAAKGLPDTRNKLLTEGKFVTSGILFDVNSDRIRAESFGVLKEISQVLKENAGVRIKIIGHTDSDGDDKANLALSQKRALAVKTALSKDFGIDSARMETDGLGESKPIDSNTTPQGKANNRRVEFLKL